MIECVKVFAVCLLNYPQCKLPFTFWNTVCLRNDVMADLYFVTLYHEVMQCQSISFDLKAIFMFVNRYYNLSLSV